MKVYSHRKAFFGKSFLQTFLVSQPHAPHGTMKCGGGEVQLVLLKEALLQSWERYWQIFAVHVMHSLSDQTPVKGVQGRLMTTGISR